MPAIEELLGKAPALRPPSTATRLPAVPATDRRARREDHARGRSRGRLLRDPGGTGGPGDRRAGPRGSDPPDAPRRRPARLVVAGPALPDRVRRARDGNPRTRSRSTAPACAATARPTRRPATTCSSPVGRFSWRACRTPACGCSTSTPSRAIAELPIAFRVEDTQRETGDTWTLRLEPADATVPEPFAPGAVRDALRVRRRGGAHLGQQHWRRLAPSSTLCARCHQAVVARMDDRRQRHDPCRLGELLQMREHQRGDPASCQASATAKASSARSSCGSGTKQAWATTCPSTPAVAARPTPRSMRPRAERPAEMPPPGSETSARRPTGHPEKAATASTSSATAGHVDRGAVAQDDVRGACERRIRGLELDGLRRIGERGGHRRS
jgi:hypothetical protein